MSQGAAAARHALLRSGAAAAGAPSAAAATAARLLGAASQSSPQQQPAAACLLGGAPQQPASQAAMALSSSPASPSASRSPRRAAAAALLSPAKLLSPARQACLLGSPGRQPFAPCNVARSPQPAAGAAKRRLGALQPAAGFACGAAPGRGDGAAGSPPPKRQDAGGGETPARAPPRGPDAPAATPPAALAAAAAPPRQQPAAPAATPRAASVNRPRHSLGGGPGALTPPSAVSVGVGGGGVLADVIAAADQVPSPRAILEFPPELEDAAAAPGGARGAPAPAGAGGAPPPAGPAGGGGPGAAAAAAARHAAMSGRRVGARYDIPLGFDWLAGAPDHAPALGEGRLELIMGPMFAGKTTRLIARVKEVTGAEGKLAVAVKSRRDERYGAHWVVSHDGRCMRCYAADSLAEFRAHMGPAYHKLQVLAIDEAQFFPDLAEFVAAAVDGDGKHVIVSGLSGDFKRRVFGQLLQLAPLADSITTLASKCAFCDADALFSLRLREAAGPQALVGGDELYRATCRRCYLTHSGVLQ
ncbi:hypothetical protein HT031_001760 [Scenedesmus sp. PABB004]|nr:hypothetical protein HT031_001760 [Scenedesmus sp. PABB004]